MIAKGEGIWGSDGLGVWDYQMQTIVYRMGRKQDPIL